MDSDELVERARATGYELVDVTRSDGGTCQWQGRWPNPVFVERGQALRWMDEHLRRRQLT